MSFERNDTTRRRLLKSIGATGIALGAAGAASASGTDDDAAATSDDEISPSGYWEYRCTSYPCDSDGYPCQQEKRYCNDGSCSGWEKDGCCDGTCVQ
jgi:hypothetical protein